MTAIPLHTRAICDACPAPATVEIESGFFLCDACAGTLTDFIAEISVAPVSSFPGVKVPTVSSAPIPVAVGTLNSVSPGEMNSSLPSGESDPSAMLDCAPGESSSCGGTGANVRLSVSELAADVPNGSAEVSKERLGCASLLKGHSAGVASGPQDSISESGEMPESSSGRLLATGMSRDPANAGGEHEEVAPLSFNDIDVAFETGTSPGACGTERERVGATNSELMCVRPSSIRDLDTGRSGRTDCSPIDLIGRDPVDGTDKAWSPGLKAVTGDNSRSGACEGNGSNADGSKTADGSARNSSCGGSDAHNSGLLSKQLSVASRLRPPGPQDSIPLPVHTPQPIPPAPETLAAPTAKVPAVPPFSLRDPGPCGMDLDAEAARLEELWTHLGILAPLTLPSRHHGGAA